MLKRRGLLFIFSSNLGRTEKTIKKTYFVVAGFWLSFPSNTHSCFFPNQDSTNYCTLILFFQQILQYSNKYPPKKALNWIWVLIKLFEVYLGAVIRKGRLYESLRYAAFSYTFSAPVLINSDLIVQNCRHESKLLYITVKILEHLLWNTEAHAAQCTSRRHYQLSLTNFPETPCHHTK